MSRGTEEQFIAILASLEKNTRSYEAKQIKHYQWAEQNDNIFANYTWSKQEFYKELGVRLGIQTNETREKKKSLKIIKNSK